jgi:hypothetical protein
VGAGATNRAGGSTTQVQYNSSGDLAGSANMTFSGTALTLANDASISGLTVGKGGGAVASNMALGYQALNGNSTGSNVTAVGYQALLANTASNNTAFGNSAGIANTSGTFNLFVGQSTGQSNTTGSSNTFVGGLDAGGLPAGRFNTTGGSNTALGGGALGNNTTASKNTVVGFQAGYSAVTSAGNTFLGYQAGYSHNGSAGEYSNTFVGFNAGYAATTGYTNTFVGYNAGSAVTTGLTNVILGSYTGNSGGLDIRTASGYIVLSDGSGNPRGIFDNNGNFSVGKTTPANTTIGFGAYAGGTVNCALSASTNAATTWETYSTGAGTYRFYVGMGGTVYATSTSISAISDQRLKENVRPLDLGLAEVMALQPRRYDWKEGKGQDKKNAVGFIAQEFETVLPNSVGTSKAGEDGIEYKNINYEELVPTLVKAIQELKAEVDSLKQQLGK